MVGQTAGKASAQRNADFWNAWLLNGRYFRNRFGGQALVPGRGQTARFYLADSSTALLNLGTCRNQIAPLS